jgi:hypothetical protein
MKSIELYQFTNKELKDILKKNQVKNYSKLNKKDLIKKVNQLTNSQEGGGGNGNSNGPSPGQLQQSHHMYLSQRVQRPVQQSRINQRNTAPPSVPATLQQARNLWINTHRQQQTQQAGPAPLHAQGYPPPPYPSSSIYAQGYPPPPPPAPLHAQGYPPPPPPAPLHAQGYHPPPPPYPSSSIYAQGYSPPPPPAPLHAQGYPPPPAPPNAQRYHPPPPPLPPQSRPRNAAQNRISCPSPGWAQQRNDCWIDSAYYAMFVPSNLQNWFIPFFIGISVSETEQLKKFSILSLEYLKGIDGNEKFMEKKRKLKKDILISIKEVLGVLARLAGKLQARSMLETYNSFGIISNYNNTGLMNRNGNGDAFIFFQFISLLDNKLRFFQKPSWTEVFKDLRQSNRSKIIQNYIKGRLRQNNDGIDIVVIDASYSASKSDITDVIRLCMNDNTVLQEILDINGFSLEAVIRGDNFHYTVDFRCADNNWHNYNNQGGSNRITSINPGTRNWQGNDGLIFIFKRKR